MQIHELNNFNGNLGSSTFAVVDNGSDTGKVSIPKLIEAATEAIDAANERIDNIIAGPAPSDAEIVDARLGANGKTYSSLGNAIRDQVKVKAGYNTVGFNQWDEMWEIGGILSNGADNPSVTDSIRSANYMPVDENKLYYFKSPVDLWGYCYDASKTFIGMLNSDSRFSNRTMPLLAGTKYIRFAFREYGTTYNNDVCINISQPDVSLSPKDGDYVPYDYNFTLLYRMLDDEKAFADLNSQVSSLINPSTAVRSQNRYNPDTITENCNVSSTGGLVVNNNANTSDYIPTEGASKMSFARINSLGQYTPGDYVAICQYDEDKTFIGSRIIGQANPITLLNNCAYVRVSVQKSDLLDEVAFDVDQIYPAELSSYFDDKYLQPGSALCTVETGHISITTSKFVYHIVNQVDNTIRQDVWRIVTAQTVNGIVRKLIWSGSDADGVVQLANETDFIGGYHGDEEVDSVRLFIDGEEVQLSDPVDNETINSLELYVVSHLYHCYDDDPSSTQTFTRNKIIRFVDGKLIVCNYWQALTDLNVAQAYMGMFSCAKDIVNGFSVNNKYELLDTTDSVAPDVNLTESHFDLDGGLIAKYSIKNGTKQNYLGSVVNYNGVGVSNRLKVYFNEIAAENYAPYVLHTGDIIRAESELEII